jgi:crotonobetainyl-CoA:carnitine CoA-transferase CaiB-like acyl-CoA transferase
VNLSETYKGLRVLDLGTNIAAPFAAMALGDMGADVIKIERPPRGDDTRSLPPFQDGLATVFMAVNRNKRSLLLDIKSAAGRAALWKLIGIADVVIDSFPPGLAAELGLTFEAMQASNPKVILCSVSAFGDGPLGATMPGYDALVQAYAGLMSFTGHAETPPVRLAPSVLDLSTGMWGLIGIMAALARRSAGGTAEHVRPSLLDSAFTLMCHQVQAFAATGDLPQKLGSGAPSAAPYRVYSGSDGCFMLATATEAQFVRLCALLGRSEMANDPRFAQIGARLANREVLDTWLSAEFSRHPVQMWLERLPSAGLSAGPVNDLRQALAESVVKERALFAVPTEAGAFAPLLRLPIDSGGAIRRPPPPLGAHNAEIFRELGIEDPGAP